VVAVIMAMWDVDSSVIMMMIILLAQGKASRWGNHLLGTARQLYALF